MQRRAMKSVRKLRNKSYEDRIKILNLPSVEQRLDRFNMIQFFKCNKIINRINRNDICTTSRLILDSGVNSNKRLSYSTLILNTKSNILFDFQH
ncbi:hypothetical protein BpHYR1_032993 [Brachionus plicatilis]|uniref:RNA-directed DNA polymerase from mobile element jockey-like n=1 Tax=Brachionus plicatilis TaxID=10195 RepID=A0A3M7RER1_BRAPC|nr:hypothetical protein BpHYR1_032993 [Brachionus plicatilis]